MGKLKFMLKTYFFTLELFKILNSYKYRGNKGNDIRLTVFPEYVEYSEKDDKFR